MAKFNIKRGLEANIPSTIANGVLYFCTDTGNLYIDIDGKRKQISSEYAEYAKHLNDGTIDIALADILTVDNLTAAINTALAQAKESGEFDGSSGVYVGSGDMPEGYNVQVDPAGTIIDLSDYALKSETLSTASGQIQVYNSKSFIFRGMGTTQHSIGQGMAGYLAGNTNAWRIVGNQTGSNAGYLEIGTAGEGDEPIYVRQYGNGIQWNTPARTLTLLDEYGNTTFPGTVTAEGGFNISADDLNVTIDSIYKGKNLSILGDSISTFSGYIPSGSNAYYTGSKGGVSTASLTWWGKVMSALGMNLCVNNSNNGNCASNINGDAKNGLIRASALHTDTVTPDVIIVYLVTNDFYGRANVGTYNGQGAVPTDQSTFRAGLSMILDTINTNYPFAEVWVCTAPPIAVSASDYPYARGSNYLNDYNSAIRELADVFGARVIEFAKCGMNFQNLSTYMCDYALGSDGITIATAIHPNEAGHSLMANEVIRSLDPGVRTRY